MKPTENIQTTFLSAINLHVRAIRLLAESVAIRKWYLSTVVISSIATIGVLLVLSFSGLWYFWDGFDVSALGEVFVPYEVWIKGLVSVVWLFLMLFMGAFLGAQLASIFVQNFVKEQKLFNAYFGESKSREIVVPKIVRTKTYFLLKEYRTTFLSLLVSLFCWPLLLIPMLLPFGLIVFSYLLGKESYDSAERICFERQRETWSEQGLHPKWTFYVGLGLPSVLLGLIPFIGWLAFPLVKLSGLMAASPESAAP